MGIDRRWAAGVGLVTALSLATVGCSSDKPDVKLAGDGDRITTTTEVVPTTTTSSSLVADYFEGMAAGTVKGFAAAQGDAEPDSPAFYYGLYLLEATRLSRPSASTLAIDGDTFRLCGEGQANEETCFVYDDISVNEAGEVVSFEVDGTPLTERMGLRGESASASGVSASVVVSYETAAGDLSIVVDLKNDSPSSFMSYGNSSSYVGTDGRQAPIRYAGLSTDIAPGAAAYDVVVVEGAQRGGTLNYEGALDDGAYTAVQLALPVP